MNWDKAIGYILGYGWMILVVIIVGVAIFKTVQNSGQLENNDVLNKTELVEAAEERSGNDCEAERSPHEEGISLTCFRDDGEYKGVEYKFAREYQAYERNGSVVVEQVFR